jgi:hypothetical protein
LRNSKSGGLEVLGLTIPEPFLQLADEVIE